MVCRGEFIFIKILPHCLDISLRKSEHDRRHTTFIMNYGPSSRVCERGRNVKLNFAYRARCRFIKSSGSSRCDHCRNGQRKKFQFNNGSAFRCEKFARPTINIISPIIHANVPKTIFLRKLKHSFSSSCHRRNCFQELIQNFNIRKEFAME